MGDLLANWRKQDTALDAERRLMSEALAQLAKSEKKIEPPRPVGRLIFGLDLTGSRQASLKQARIATAAMFDTIKAIGRIKVKLAWYRGWNECKESAWCDDPDTLRRSMLKLSCECGETQIAKLLRVALAQTEKPSGMIFVGDDCEENVAELQDLARCLGQKKIPLFVFHECSDGDPGSLHAKPTFKRMAELSGGVYVEFTPDSGEILRELLAGIAAFAAGGARGVESMALPVTRQARELRDRLLLGVGSAVKETRR